METVMVDPDTKEFLETRSRATAPGRPTAIENFGKQDTRLDPISGKEYLDEAKKWYPGKMLPGNQTQKADAGKPMLSRLPWGPLKQIARVLMFGKAKYGKWGGWQEVDNARERYTDALTRHVADYCEGKRTDEESGLPVLAHAGCDLLFILWFDGHK